MHPHTPLITTLASALGLALLLGLLAARLRLPALVGYLVAGVVIGPFTPGFVADTQVAAELAEIGVMLLMFGVGLHFSLDDLLQVRRIAVPGAAIQIGVATALGAVVAALWGWDAGAALVFGLALSVASTVVLLRALQADGSLNSMHGRIAVGWLIVEDLAMVLVLVLLPPLAGLLGGKSATASPDLWTALGMTLLKVAAFIAVMLLAGRRLVPKALGAIAATGSRELFTLSVVVAAISIAWASASLFGVSFALGAFFAGMVMRETEFGHRAAEESLPLREAFSVLFFVSVGMLFDPMILIQRPGQVAVVVAIVILGKSAAAAMLVLSMHYPLRTALTVSASLAQIGEFSFILAGLGMSLHLLPPEAPSLILAGALISIACNPLVFASVDPLQRWLAPRLRAGRIAEADDEPDPLAQLPANTPLQNLSGHVVVVGHGRIGSQVAQLVAARGLACVIVDQNREIVERLRAHGQMAVCGDACDPAVLIQAHVARAGMLVITMAASFDVQPMLQTARQLNPSIGVTLRMHHRDDAILLETDAQTRVIVSDDELAAAIGKHVLDRFGRA